MGGETGFGRSRRESGPGLEAVDGTSTWSAIVRLVRAEWTKFRSVRGWAWGSVVAALLILVFPATGLGGGPPEHLRPVPVGPDGEPVSAGYYFVHRALAGDGQITVAVSGLTSQRGADGGSVAPWAKAGLLISAGEQPGARYAAVMVTGGHGVRMQYDYLHDYAGPAVRVPASAVRWLRLTRAGDLVTGESSVDGAQWSGVATVQLQGLERTAEVGLFVACPARMERLGSAVDAATASFGAPRLVGDWAAGEWSGEQRGTDSASFAGLPREVSAGFAAAGDGFTVTGGGDLAPATRNDLAVAATPGDLLFGTFPALIVIVVIATLMMTTEFRYRVIRSTFGVSPRRGRVLVVKAFVIGGVTFVTSLVAAVVAVPVWLRLVRGLGIYVFPAAPGALLRAEVGTAAVLAVTAVFALAVGGVLRRSATAVTVVVVATVLPHLLARVPFLPAGMARWLTEVTPAAGLAVQQTLVRYPQVDSVYTPANGYFPLSPAAGFGVLCAYAGVALALAVVLLRRRDA
ncbi:DUF1349 domain-containing protein [Dactylosporangium vinaceum]|uniref:DUF1349 domain-containing protein n=1 Tax=Dactylosporangium vinaceum TaxID=53362 RepID=A0ABV5MJR3_9ACTN|nr:DUF1349 domain-containing protein [Dactylosporangium vinaceum]